MCSRALCSCGLGFLYQRFSSLLGDEACQFRNQQSRTWFYKSRSQEKTLLLRLEFFLLLSPLDRASSVLTYRAMCSVARPCDSVGWVFSISGFHRFLATKPVSSETNKAERGSIKAEVKKKHFSCGWNFSCFSAHSIELVLF